MKIPKSSVLAACIGAIYFSSVVSAAPFVFLDENVLDENRKRLHSGEASNSQVQSYERLLEEAASAMKAGPFSVTDKGMMPPSGSRNDYLSISPYWWPDPSKEDGLPWIRRDGKTNPASKTSDTDSRRIGHFTRSVRALAIAYTFSRDEQYAERGIEFIRTWFFDPTTKMNPNMNFAQGVPGITSGRRYGLIDSRVLVDRMLDAIAMLSASPYWTDEDEKQIKAWYGEYLHWLLTDELSGGPEGEAYSENNHGSWYDLQVAGISYFLGKTDLTRELVEKGRMRIDTQFDKEGRQAHELARTRAYHYSTFNLDALAGLAQIGEKVGVDLWHYESPGGGSLEKGIQLMADYNDPGEKWPYAQKDPRRRVERMAPIFLKAGFALDNDAFIDLAVSADFDGFTVTDNLAEIWAERDIELLYPRK
ncbi:MAG: alginate lyase [Verrucomicrobia bacterium]|nr:MAG: alginate lyase [Verrucomicrobiota bacterium]